MPTLLSGRQETFCRVYAVSGNAAAAARAAGYAETSARQQGYANLHKPYIQIRLDEIRRGFAETAGREAAILLGRLEQVWPLAAAAGSTHAMLMTIAMQAKLSGLTGDAATRVRLWGPDGQAGPLERAVEHAGDGDALAAAEAALPRAPDRAARRDAAPAATFPDEPEPEYPDDDPAWYGLPAVDVYLEDAGEDDPEGDLVGVGDCGLASEGAGDPPAATPHPPAAEAAGPSLSPKERGAVQPDARPDAGDLDMGAAVDPSPSGRGWPRQRPGEGSPPDDATDRHGDARGEEEARPSSRPAASETATYAGTASVPLPGNPSPGAGELPDGEAGMTAAAPGDFPAGGTTAAAADGPSPPAPRPRGEKGAARRVPERNMTKHDIPEGVAA